MLALADNDYDRTQWQDLIAMEETIQSARAASNAGEFAKAVARLESVKLPAGVEPTRLNLLEAEAETAGGDVAGAYDRLANLVAAQPRDDYVKALSRAAADLKRRASDVKADLRGRRDKLARPAPDFTLTNYTDGKPMALSSLRGKVVLLDFWYPG